MTERTRPPLRTKGFVWGRRRVELGLSLRQLAALAGINRGDLSKMEAGRMIPSADEFARVTAALEQAADGKLPTA